MRYFEVTFQGLVEHTDTYYLLRIKAHLNELFEQALDAPLVSQNQLVSNYRDMLEF